MILTDANILIYAYNTEAKFHRECKEWLTEQLSKPEPFAFSWQTITAFLRITTTPKLFSDAFTQAEVHGFCQRLAFKSQCPNFNADRQSLDDF